MIEENLENMHLLVGASASLKIHSFASKKGFLLLVTGFNGNIQMIFH